MALGKQHVSGFSPDGKLFALINEQGILRIWDTETNELRQEYTPNLHLAGPCTSLLWLAISTKKKSKKSRNSVGNEETEPEATLYLALGGSTGDISLYSFASGTVERKLNGEGHAGKVNCIAYDGHGLLLTCGDDCQVIVWDLLRDKPVASWSVGNEKPKTLAYIPNLKYLIVGSRQIKVYSVQGEEIAETFTFTGHNSEVSLLSTISSGNKDYAISASKMERIICLWTIDGKKKSRNAACTFLMEDIANCLTCKVDDSNNLKVASVTRSGVIHFYQISLDSIRPEKPHKPNVTIEIASDSSTVIEPIPAVSASLQFGSTEKEILFAYGNNNFIVFEQIAPNFTEKLQVLVRTDPKKILTSSLKKTAKDTKTLIPTVIPGNVDYKSAISVPKKRNLKEVEAPMEIRLQNLNLSKGEIPQAQSKVQLLVQALQSKDASLLRTVLTTNDPKVIVLTLQKLPVQYVGSLVNELTLLMQKKRFHVEISLNWLKVLVQTHSSQLMALGADELLNKFGPCIGIIEHRANCLKEVSKLNGRLQLLVSQIKRNTEEDNLNNENILIYEDNDSSNSDVEEENGNNSPSDDEWEEDESDEEMET